MKVLLAEDDHMLGSSIKKGLGQAGFTVDWVSTGPHALRAARDNLYDVMLLDIGLPQMDGLKVLAELRRLSYPVPVLLVTARDAVHDRVTGLNLGADDYLGKPFDLDELVARIHALMRRQAGRRQPMMRLGHLVVDPVAHVAQLNDQVLALSPREFRLLCALMEQPGAVLSIEKLEERLYGWDDVVSSNAVEVHLHHLRRKLGDKWIRNVRGVGYKMVLPE